MLAFTHVFDGFLSRDLFPSRERVVGEYNARIQLSTPAKPFVKQKNAERNPKQKQQQSKKVFFTLHLVASVARQKHRLKKRMRN
jgi:hypothetical protein